VNRYEDKRLAQQESKEVTRMRLIEAVERVFIRKGFEGASVEEISETAGYSRGALLLQLGRQRAGI